MSLILSRMQLLRALSLCLFLCVAPAARAEHAPLISSSMQPEVCQVPTGTGPVDCQASELTAAPSAAGVVPTRIVARVQIPTSVMPLTDQLVVAKIRLFPTDGAEAVDATWLWGESFDGNDDPRSTFAADDYFAAGATGDAKQPRGRSSVGDDGTAQLAEALDAARSISSQAFDLYLDLPADSAAKTFHGPSASDTSKRPLITFASVPGHGFRTSYDFTSEISTAHHEFLLNNGNGNLLIKATDAELGSGAGMIERFANSLAGTRWNSGYDAESLFLGFTNHAWALPTGEIVATSTGFALQGGSTRDPSPAQTVGRSPTDAPSHAWNLAPLGVSSTLGVDGSDGVHRDYTMPGVDYATALLKSGFATKVHTFTPDRVSEDADSSTVLISRDETSVTLSDQGGSVLARGTLRADGQVSTWTSAANGEALATYDYDDQGRVVGVTESDGAMTYSYSADGQLTQVVDTDGETVSIAYDEQGRVSRLEARSAAADLDVSDARSYVEPSDACGAHPETESVVSADTSAGDKATWCVAGTGRIVDASDDPAPIPELDPVECTETETTSCPTPGPDGDTLVGTGARLASPQAYPCDGATPAPNASLRAVLGIEDDFNAADPATELPLWSSERLQCIAPTWARRIAAWNIANGNPRYLKDEPADSHPTLRARYQALVKYVQDAHAYGAKIIVSFEPCADPFGQASSTCAKPPRVSEYRRAIQRFLKDPAFANVGILTAFNESNLRKRFGPDNKAYAYLSGTASSKQASHWHTTNSGAYLAGRYWRELSLACKDRTIGGVAKPCTPLAGDLSDNTDPGSSNSKPKTWLTQYLQGMGETRHTQWALHYYTSVKRRGTLEPGHRCAGSEMAVNASGDACWRPVSRLMRALRTAILPNGSTRLATWYFTEGGPLYRANGGKIGPASEGGKIPVGITPTSDRDSVVRSRAAYIGVSGLVWEYARLAKKWDARIPAIVHYMWEYPRGIGQTSNDVGMAGALPFQTAADGSRINDDGNLLKERVRPTYMAWCEALFTTDDDRCWQFDDPGTGPPPAS